MNVSLGANDVGVHEEQVEYDDNLNRRNVHVQVFSRLLLLDQREEPLEEYVVPKENVEEIKERFDGSEP